MIVKGVILFGIQHFQQGRGRVAAKVHGHFINLVEQKQRILFAHSRHALHDLARHGADIGAAVAAYLGLITHAAKRHTHEFAVGRARDGAPKRGLAHSGRPHQTEDRAFHFLDALLHREVFQDAFLDLVEAIVIFLKDLLGLDDILRDLAASFPWHARQPVHVIPDHRGLGRHRRHHPELV